MKKSKKTPIALALLLVFAMPSIASPVQLVSYASGEVGNGRSVTPVTSADGRYVAFVSEARNLTNQDLTTAWDLFLRDRTTGITKQINLAKISDDNAPPSYFSISYSVASQISISGDGRYVAFVSLGIIPVEEAKKQSHEEKNDLVYNIYLYDNKTEKIKPISVNSQGELGNFQSLYPNISLDGRYVVFQSLADNLTQNDTNKNMDIFFHDIQEGTTRLISKNTAGVQANGYSTMPKINADGRLVTYQSTSSNLDGVDANADFADIFIHFVQTGVTRLVNKNSEGEQANKASANPGISADGRYIVFDSDGTNLVKNDTNNTKDVFIHDNFTRTTERLSVSSGGVQTNSMSSKPSISGDGNKVAFFSMATNLLPEDMNFYGDIFLRNRKLGTTTAVSVNNQGSLSDGYTRDNVSISSDGRFVAFESNAYNLVPDDNNKTDDIFLHDNELGLTELISRSSNKGANKNSLDAKISANGRFVVFESEATDLVKDVRFEPNTKNIFLRDKITGDIELISRGTDGSAGNEMSYDPSISEDGRYVAYLSKARNIILGDSNEQVDLFVLDRQTGDTKRVNLNNDGQVTNAPIDDASISADGRFVVFTTEASNLVATSKDNTRQVFVRDLVEGTVQLVSINDAGQAANDKNSSPAISSNGRFVTFTSFATNLIAKDDNKKSDIFVRDLQSKKTTLISKNSAGEQSDGISSSPAISGDGRYVAFESRASNLASGVSTNITNLYVHDTQAGSTELVSVSSDGKVGNKTSRGPRLSHDGNLINFYSSANNLVNHDENNHMDVFLRNMRTGITQLLSDNEDDRAGNSFSRNADISADGLSVTFESDASSIVPVAHEGDNIYITEVKLEK